MTPTLSTTGLVLHTTAYSDTSVIAKIFTRELGVRSYILKGVRKSGSRTKQNLLQPLTHLDLVVYDNPKASINYLKEIVPHSANANIESTPINNALRFFMTELLYKTLREEEPMPQLFDYVAQAIPTHIDNVANLPITFLLTVSRHLGIEPLDNYSSREPIFDLRGGRFSYSAESSLPSQSSMLLHYYLQFLHDNAPCPMATLAQRNELVNNLLEYYQLHLAEFRNFKSHEILHTVLQ